MIVLVFRMRPALFVSALALLPLCACDFDWGNDEEPICREDRCGIWEGRDCGDCSYYDGSDGCLGFSSEFPYYCSSSGHCILPHCGNDLIEPGEICESEEARSCVEVNPTDYLSGSAPCNENCNGWYAGDCVFKNYCGNEVIEEGEDCEWNNDTMLCIELDPVKYMSGTAFCDAYCQWTTGECSLKDVCGNGVIEEELGEACERYDTLSCIQIDPAQYSGGTAYCLNDCSGWDIASCTKATKCGNGVMDLGEECDTSNSIPCLEIDPEKYSGGTSYCNNDCTGWDLSTCVE